MGDVFPDGPAKVSFAEWHQPVETLRLDRTDEPLDVGIRIRCPIGGLDDPEPCVFKVAADRLTPLRVSVAEQDLVVGERPVAGEYQRAGHLLHEEGGGMRSRAENLNPPTRQIQNETA
jgi:hypothetical protein